MRALMICSSFGNAADWLYLSATEPLNAPSFRVWGFTQIGYQKDYGTIFNKDGINKTPFAMIPPSLEKQSGFELNRARLALRGKFDKANTFNYFVMSEFGINGITKPAGHSSNNYLTDLSVTYRAIPYLNIRIGQFKYPGSEEGMRAVFASEYRNFSNAGSQLLLERFIPNNSQEVSPDRFQAAPTTSVGAFRDRGVELFYTFALKKNIKLSLAGMVGSGTGLSSENFSGKPTYYAYLANEYIFGGKKGYFQESLKSYAWYQNGKRRLQNRNYTRERYGFGIDYFHKGLRIDLEYIKAKGMIYNGAKDVESDPYGVDWEYQIAASSDNKADGAYISTQYYIVARRVELLMRYDYLHRLTNSAKGRRDYKTTTVGLSYHFYGANRIDLNYAFRSIDAPDNQSADEIVENVGNLLSVQATLKF